MLQLLPNLKRLRFLLTFAGVLPCPPGKKNSYTRLFKGKSGKLSIFGKGNKCRFQGKKTWITGFFFNYAKENCKNDCENDHALFSQINESIRYQNSADFCEIWPEHCLDAVKSKCVYSLLFEIDRLIKKITSQNIEKCSDTFQYHDCQFHFDCFWDVNGCLPFTGANRLIYGLCKW